MKDWESAGKVTGSGEQIAGEEPWKVRIETTKGKRNRAGTVEDLRASTAGRESLRKSY